MSHAVGKHFLRAEEKLRAGVPRGTRENFHAPPRFAARLRRAELGTQNSELRTQNFPQQTHGTDRICSKLRVKSLKLKS